MRTLFTTVLAAVVAACTACSESGSGSESNFQRCRTDADCDGGACINERCATAASDASPPTPSAADADAGQTIGADAASTDASSGSSARRLQQVMVNALCESGGMCVAYRYDARGNLIEVGNDFDCDGTAENVCTTYEYDSENREIGSGNDGNCDGVPESCMAKGYDANGNLVRQGQDANCDGTAEAFCTAYTVDANGDEIAWGNDSDCDGTADNECVVAFSLPNPASPARLDTYGDPDANCDGTAECTTFEFTRDSADRVILATLIAPCLGLAFTDDCVRYTYDAAGNLTFIESFAVCNGSPGGCSTYRYDSGGRIIEARDDLGCDGTPIRCYLWTYDSEGNLATEGLDANCDGTAEEDCRAYYYE